MLCVKQSSWKYTIQWEYNDGQVKIPARNLILMKEINMNRGDCKSWQYDVCSEWCENAIGGENGIFMVFRRLRLGRFY